MWEVALFHLHISRFFGHANVVLDVVLAQFLALKHHWRKHHARRQHHEHHGHGVGQSRHEQPAKINRSHACKLLRVQKHCRTANQGIQSSTSS